MKIVLATSNRHKVQEINEIVKSTTPELEVEFVLPPENFDPVENGTTFEENSYIKAYEAWKISKNWTLADDSGLCIDSLGGKPGIYSARYAETPEKRIRRVLEEMQAFPPKERTAFFACSMTLINPSGEVEFKYQGICNGVITDKPYGNNGFGYDPIFKPCGYDKTIAELSEKEKNEISHRGKALREVLNYFYKISDTEKVKK